MENQDDIDDGKRYVVGGITEISYFIAKEYKYSKPDLIKKKFIQKDDITLSNLEDFDFDGLADIVRYIANGCLPGMGDYIEKNLAGEILLFQTPNIQDKSHKNLCCEFVKNSNLDEDDKSLLIRKIEDFKIEFSATDFLRSIYKDSSIYELNQIIPFVLDIKIEQEYRLKKLRDYLSLFNKAILKNNEILNSRARQYQKECAQIINDFLNGLLNTINIELREYVDLLNNVYTDLLEHTYSRADILKSLTGNDSKNLDKYFEYERKLIDRGFISSDSKIWNKTPILLIKFYAFCERRYLFNDDFRKSNKGTKLIRNLYNFHDGTSIDFPRKRKEITDAQLSSDFFFLK